MSEITNRPSVIGFDEYYQEEFSDDSINVHCVLSWRSSSKAGLRVDFHNGFWFDSSYVPTDPKFLDVPPAYKTIASHRVEAALLKLQMIAADTG